MDGDERFKNGVMSRIAVLEAGYRSVREDIRDLKNEDIRDIKTEVRRMREDFAKSRQGMTRAEKIALVAVSVTIIMAIIAAIALIQQAPA